MWRTVSHQIDLPQVCSHILRLFEVTDWTFAYCGYDQANQYFKCLDVYFKCLFRLQFEKAATEKMCRYKCTQKKTLTGRVQMN